MNKTSISQRTWIFLFFIFAVFFKAQTGIRVYYYTGSNQGYVIENSGKIYFNTTDVLIKTNASATDISIPISIIDRITFDNSLLSVENISLKKQGYVLYPNPTSDYIKIKSPQSSKIKVIISDSSGKKIHEGEYESDESITIENLPSGIYFVKANSETFKIIKK